MRARYGRIQVLSGSVIKAKARDAGDGPRPSTLAYRPLAAVEPPEPKNSGLAKTPSNRFILAPAPEISREKLARRLILTTTALPPYLTQN
jgi:hypothetical protein